ncbi:hypothetical protein Tco_0679466 [Tanacetum coccineum]|uniref:Uncharacterized protein n=1 Tax=Tanacetum coccineum TaxID=301880 RepID=A0ABQ4XJD4_9ASTR
MTLFRFTGFNFLKRRKDSGPREPIPDEATNEEPISTPSCDPPQSGKDRLQLTGLISLCTKVQKQVLDLEEAKTSQAKEIASLKKREDASKQGRKIVDLKDDAEVTLIDETQERNDEDLMFDTDVLNSDEVFEEPIVNSAKTTSSSPVSAADPVTTAGEVVTTAATTITTDVASTRPKAKGIVFHDQEEQAPAFTPIVSSSQASHTQAKDKGKAKMVEPEKPLKKKDQIALDEELALRMHAEEQEKLEKMQKERVAQEEASRAEIIEELDSIEAMIEADEQLATRLQAEEQEQFFIEEKSRMLVEMIAKRKKFFAAQRVAKQRSKPPTKTQIRNRMCTYIKNMGGYKHNQLKGRSYEEIKKFFAYKQLEIDKSKKQKIDKHVEAEKDDDQEEAKMKKHIEIVKDDEVAIDAIPLATKPLMIVEYKIVKEGKFGYFQLIRGDRSSKRYLSMIKILQNINREDLETLWKLVRAKHRNTRPEEDYERVLWGDLKVMFEPDIKSKVWRNLQGYKMTIWKLFDTCGVHFVRFKNLHIFMLVEKRYPLIRSNFTYI